LDSAVAIAAIEHNPQTGVIMQIEPDQTIGAIAANHPASTKVFERHRIDFCCGGSKSLRDVCDAHSLPLDVVLTELSVVLEERHEDASLWLNAPLADLITHIQETYHNPLYDELPRLENMASRVLHVHGPKDFDRLSELALTLQSLHSELIGHMQKEEQILFPAILDGQTVDGPLLQMEREHLDVARMLETLHTLTDAYKAPKGACATWRALWSGLESLECELHAHIHLEENILFPRALGRNVTI
jgi:regulator of cell morphogenesis and NO signaling